MIPSAGMVLDFARKLCHDTEIPGGQRYTDAYLQPYAQSVWADLFQAYAIHRLPRASRQFFYILPPFTASLSVSTLGVSPADLDHIEERMVNLEEILTIANIEPHTSADAETKPDQCRVTTTNQEHNFVDGDRVALWGVGPQITDDINDTWMVRPVGPPMPYHFVLMGCTASATEAPPLPYNPSQTASILKTSSPFSPMKAGLNQDQQPLSAGLMGNFEWREGKLIFRGSSSAIQLRLRVKIAPNFPTLATDSLGIEGCYNYLSYGIAARALRQDDPRTAQDYAQDAWGSNSFEPDLMQPGGHLKNFLHPQRRQEQASPAIIRPGYGADRRRGFRFFIPR
jgi:hypothetical protein